MEAPLSKRGAPAFFGGDPHSPLLSWEREDDGQSHIIVIGASAGGVEALRVVCRMLPGDLPAAVFIVQHIAASAKSMLAELLDGPLPALVPTEGDPIVPGRIYVAAPDRHLLLRENRILMRRGPHENRTRPSADALFRSAAVAYGPRVIGVVLTGMLDDGTEGLIAIKAAGGLSVVQDPADAEWPSMPRAAIARDDVDHSVPLIELGRLLGRLSRDPPGPSRPISELLVREDQAAAEETPAAGAAAVPGTASDLACPDCGGVLNRMPSEGSIRFRCQIGHAFTPEGLAAAQADELERALVLAARTHRDRIRLFTQLKADAEGRNSRLSAERWGNALLEAKAMVEVLNRALAGLRKPAVDRD